jgi:hypothetical protein
MDRMGARSMEAKPTEVTGQLDRLKYVTGQTWRIKLKGRRAVTVTSAVLDGVWMDYSSTYTITVDGSRNALEIRNA